MSVLTKEAAPVGTCARVGMVTSNRPRRSRCLENPKSKVVSSLMLFLIGAVSLNVMPFFLPRPRNSWVSGSSVELPKALLWIRKPLCAITSRYSQQVKASPGVSPGRFGFQCEAALSKESVVVVVFLSFLVAVLCRRRRTGHNSWSDRNSDLQGKRGAVRG